MVKSRGNHKGQAGDDKRFAVLLSEMSQTVSVFGVQKTSAILRDQRFLHINTDDPQIKSLLEIVAGEFGITVQEILVGNSRRGGYRSTALGMVIYFLYYTSDLSMNRIATILDKKPSNCTNLRKLIEGMSEKSKNPEEREFVNKRKSIKEKFTALKPESNVGQ